MFAHPICDCVTSESLYLGVLGLYDYAAHTFHRVEYLLDNESLKKSVHDGLQDPRRRQLEDRSVKLEILIYLCLLQKCTCNLLMLE